MFLKDGAGAVAGAGVGVTQVGLIGAPQLPSVHKKPAEPWLTAVLVKVIMAPDVA